MSRTIERSIARHEYNKFVKRWKQEKRLAGLYGKPGYRRPDFAEWYGMHQKNLEMMKQSAPADVVEYMGDDPWSEGTERPPVEEPKSDRGVVTIDMQTGIEEE